MANAGRVEYRPVARWKTGLPPDGFVERPDVYMLPVSPPDRHGYCSFGPAVFFSPSFCRDATTVIGEVHENFIRTGGDNYVHVSQLDRLCEAAAPTGVLPVAPRSEEEDFVTEVVGTLVAGELIKDRDTIQIGIGTVASAMGAFLGEKHDLGIQTEIITGGVADLVRQGVVTGKYKTRHQNKVVASVALVPEDELAIIDGNPAFELYEFNYIDDVRYLMQQDNLVAINNALQIDLTGQVAAETIGSTIWSGVGGQTAFSIAANYSNGGRSITVLPSSSLVEGERVSRIVPTLPGGAAVTVPRDAGGLRGHRTRHRSPARQVAAGAGRGTHRHRPPRLSFRAAKRRQAGVQHRYMRAGCRRNQSNHNNRSSDHALAPLSRT